MPSTAPKPAPTHRWAALSAGIPVVSTATARVESQKNTAGQRGPRRSAMRAWTNVNVATITGTRPSATSPTPSRSGLVPMKLCPTVPRPR